MWHERCVGALQHVATHADELRGETPMTTTDRLIANVTTTVALLTLALALPLSGEIARQLLALASHAR